jgi:hypothetical protein
MDWFNLNKLNEMEGKKKYQAKVSNRFAASEDLDSKVKIKSAWETIRENITISSQGQPRIL